LIVDRFEEVDVEQQQTKAVPQPFVVQDFVVQGRIEVAAIG
jgi:hypothetical protein